jgi:hypothetical protein
MRTPLESIVKPGELILWRARPIRRAFLQDGFGLLMVGGLFLPVFWASFASIAFEDVAPPPWWNGLFAFIGCGLLAAPYWKGREADATEYGITNQRAIVISASSCESFSPSELLSLKTITRDRGCGSDVILKVTPAEDGMDHYIGFIAIDDAAHAVRSIRDLVKQHDPGAEVKIEDLSFKAQFGKWAGALRACFLTPVQRPSRK